MLYVEGDRAVRGLYCIELACYHIHHAVYGIRVFAAFGGEHSYTVKGAVDYAVSVNYQYSIHHCHFRWILFLFLLL